MILNESGILIPFLPFFLANAYANPKTSCPPPLEQAPVSPSQNQHGLQLKSLKCNESNHHFQKVHVN